MAQVNIRVDDLVKAKAESACSDMGMSMTTAINIFLVKLGNERRIPFEVSAQPSMSKVEAESLFLQKMKKAEDEKNVKAVKPENTQEETVAADNADLPGNPGITV
jgi:DNA-damage-inducible protein J